MSKATILTVDDDPWSCARMPGMTGTEMLEQARAHAPDAELLLLTAYADTDGAIWPQPPVGEPRFWVTRRRPARAAGGVLTKRTAHPAITRRR